MLCFETFLDALRNSMLWKECGPQELVVLFAFLDSRGIMIFKDAQEAHFFIGNSP